MKDKRFSFQWKPHLLTFPLISLGMCVLFLLIGAISVFKTDFSLAEKFTTEVSIDILQKALEYELPNFKLDEGQSPITTSKITQFAIQILTDVSVNNKITFLKYELPGLSQLDEVNLTANIKEDHYPSESASLGQDIPNTAKETEQKVSPKVEQNQENGDTVEGKVFIYNTHNTESWSYIAKDPDVKDPQNNIMLVSQKLGKELERRGIKTIVNKTDHQEMLKEKGLTYSLSYAMSHKTVQKALKMDKAIRFVFDLHIDSGPKKLTTTIINGKTYARLYFVVGLKNPHWEENSALANKIHKALNIKYPGLSRGVLGKGSAGGNGEYNQSLSPNSVLIEMGGIENTQEEVNNTVSALADVIADTYYHKAKKVNAPASSTQKQ